jgi:hypothetical protein
LELDISSETLSLEYQSGAENTFEITSNTTWSISSDADWLSVTPSTGSDDETIILTANTENSSTNSRTATLTISGDGVSEKVISVTQSGAQILSGNELGNTTVYSLATTTANCRAVPVTFTETGEITSISIYHSGGSDDMLLGVYSDDAGFPDALLGTTAVSTVSTAEGWQTINLQQSVSVTSGQTVWLSWLFENSPNIRYSGGSPGRASSSKTWTDGTLPATFGSSSIASWNYSIYCNYQVDQTKSAQISQFDNNELQTLETDLKVYPNPFTDHLKFQFVAPESVNASIDLYDMNGRIIKIFNQSIEGGVSYNANYYPDNLTNGMYVYKIVLGKEVITGKVIYKKH